MERQAAGRPGLDSRGSSGRGVVFAPDYLVNAGALIRGAEFFLDAKPDSTPSIQRIYERTLAVLQRAREERESPARVADRMAEERLSAAG